MLIQHRQARPIPTVSTATDKPMKGRLPLSALCNNVSQYTHLLPESSRVTSPTQSSTSQETLSPPVSHIRHAFQSPSPLPNTSPSVEETPDQHLPSIDHFHLPSCQSNSHSRFSKSKLPFSLHPDRPTCLDRITSCVAPTSPRYNPYPKHLPSPSISPDFLLNTSSSKLPCCPTKHHNGGRVKARGDVDHFLPPPYNKIRTKSLSTDSYPKRRYSSQTASRMCTNCGISQTRQWVRGEKQSWLCHSCGQFWRKNGYSRPRALWNRPTFKRSSRKTRLVGQNDGATRSKGSPRQTVSSSFLNGKKMIQWEIRLPPLQVYSDFRDTLGTQNGLTGGYIGSVMKSRSEDI